MQNVFTPFLLVGFLVAITATQNGAQESRTQDVLLGPILLGDIYDKMDDQRLSELPYTHLSKELSIGDKAHRGLVKAMNKCKLFILQKVRNEKQAKTYAGDATALMQGTFVFECVNGKGEKLVICVKEIKLIGGIICNGIASSNFSVDFLVTWFKKEKPFRQREYGFGSEEFRWNVDRLLDQKKKAPRSPPQRKGERKGGAPSGRDRKGTICQ